MVDDCESSQPALQLPISKLVADTVPMTESGQWMTIGITAEGIIEALSGQAEQWIGYSASELAGKSLATILSDGEFEAPRILKAAGESLGWAGKVTFCNRMGDPVGACAWVTKISGRGNQPAGFVAFAFIPPPPDGDSPLPGISAYLREVAHEMNNPLAVILGFTQLILLDGNCSGKVRADVERVYSEMNRIVQIVERLHGFAISLPKMTASQTAETGK
jgi:nitrogen-specific signal transduction histidine kinase